MYFSEHFTASRTKLEEVVQCIPTKITSEKNSELLKDVIGDEINNAVFQMHPDKSHGPAGITPAFFQKHWKIVGNDVIQLVDKFFKEVFYTGRV